MNNELFTPTITTKSSHGFTLLELLVVLAVIGAMVSVAVFFATPSSTDEGQRLGAQVFDLIQKGRINSMLKRKIYGIEVLENDTEVELRLVVFGGGEIYTANLSAEDFTFDEEQEDDFISINGDDKDEEEVLPPSYADHKEKALALGLINWESEMSWDLENEEDVLIVPESIGFAFRQEKIIEEPTVVDSIQLDEDGEYEEEEIIPVVLFFPDGKINSAGNFRFMNSEGVLLYGFTWTELGEFEKIN